MAKRSGALGCAAAGALLASRAFVIALCVAFAPMLSLVACAHAPSASPVLAGERAFLRVEIFFGRSRHDGPEVGDTEWQRFIDEVVTPAFPAGITVFDAAGQWREPDGTIEHERSKVVVSLVAAHEYDAARVERVCASYLARFHQQSVLRSVGSVDARF